MDRARHCAGPGPHIIGNFHIKAPAARRARLRRDTGELDPIGEIATIDWMIAQGARRRGERSDLQEARKDLLCDPADTWLPADVDYEDLAVEHDRGWLDRARAAVRDAVAEAEDNRGELIEADIDKVNAAVAQDEGVPVKVNAAVIEDFSERWFIVERLRPDGTVVPYEEAVALMDAAMDGIADDDIEELFERTELLDDTVLIEPARHYAWCAVTN